MRCNTFSFFFFFVFCCMCRVSFQNKIRVSFSVFFSRSATAAHRKVSHEDWETNWIYWKTGPISIHPLLLPPNPATLFCTITPRDMVSPFLLGLRGTAKCLGYIALQTSVFQRHLHLKVMTTNRHLDVLWSFSKQSLLIWWFNCISLFFLTVR